jgi:general secretion pathway protein K
MIVRESTHKREEGIALILVMTVLALMSVLIVDMQTNTSTAFQVATTERDRLKAEYIAKSGLNLTRLLIAREPAIRAQLGALYQLATKRAPPQLNVWAFANDILAPFNDLEGAKQEGANVGIDFSQMEGLKDLGGRFEVVSFPENGKINVNNALFLTGNEAKASMAMQMFALTGGLQSPASPYDPMFEQRDADDKFSSRIDIIAAMIDWWDLDQTRSVYDPSTAAVREGGGEDDIYSQFKHPYKVKNAPFDSLEELRLIRGVGDDFWSTFVEPDPDDPRKRMLTVYASGAVNPNEANPIAIIARLCSIAGAGQPLCMNPMEASKFVQLLSMVRSMIPIPLFSQPSDFIDFVAGTGGPGSITGMLAMFLPPGNALMFVPLTVPAGPIRTKLEAAFITSAAIFTIQSTGTVGKTRVKLSAIVNTHNRWTPPPPNAGTMPGLGVIQHYRID